MSDTPVDARRTAISSLPHALTPQPSADDEVPILVVDDQAANRLTIEAVLEQSGCRLVHAQSADEALLALLEEEFAAIILDIRMPGMTGLELAEVIKCRRSTRSVPILFLTAHMLDETDVLRGYGTGAVDYLTKPIHAEILRSKISVFVDLFRKTRAAARANEALQREIAERERIQAALRRANQELEERVRERTEQLERADRRKDEFLASLAHELRNPLAPIRSAAELLDARQPSPASLATARSVIVRQLEQMTRLIDDLLDVGRITSDRLVLQIGLVDVSRVVETAVETSRPLIAERRQHLTVQLPSQPTYLEADLARVSQVLSNLLTNAAKYTAPGGGITVAVEREDGWVLLRVRDTGQGIDSVLLPRVFDLFVRGVPASGRLEGGLGIGLALAKRLVEMHGGTISVTSDGVGKGSEFLVKLPIAQGTYPAMPHGASKKHGELPPVPRRRVLIVDDNQDAADMLALMFTGWGQETSVAYSGPEALTVAASFQPEIVLLDLGLPGLSGYDVARRLRATAGGSAVRLVAVTGWGSEADRQRTRDAGFDEHLVKPVAPEALHTLLGEPEPSR